MAVDAIIFDFDGVIIDTETPDLEVWQEFYRAHGLEVSADLWAGRAGYNEQDAFDPGRHFEQLTGLKFDATHQSEWFQQYIERCKQQPMLPGVRALIQQAFQQGIKLAIASSSYREWIDPFLRQHNLSHYFDCLCTRESVRQGKPAPDLYLKAVECLGIPIERCIAIEDSPNGMKAALAAGIRCIAVPNPLTARLERPIVTLALPSLANLDLETLRSQF